MSQRVPVVILSKSFWDGGKGKPSVKSALASLSRYNYSRRPEAERACHGQGEVDSFYLLIARTREPCNTLGRAVARSEKLIELGNSWFSPK